jgi:3'(2'), 5'-bisphosphate nucleotidase
MVSEFDRELSAVQVIARRAGAAAMAHYGAVAATAKADASPVTEADHASDRLIVAALHQVFPGDAVLSEESSDSPSRLGARRVWIVDPLDGTKEFLAGNGEFSIMIGLAVEGEAVLGVVYLPDGDVSFCAARGSGAWVERGGVRRRLNRVAAGPTLRLVGSRSHAEPLVERMCEELGITDVAPCGSVGVKCSRIAEDLRDVYVHPVPYLKEWDTCAPEVIVREAGGLVGDCRGDALRYNKPDPRQPHGIVACAPGCAEAVLAVVRPLYEASLEVAVR